MQEDICDLGIVGMNIIEECRLGLEAEGVTELFTQVSPLDYGHCRLSFGYPETGKVRSIADLTGARIATSYPWIVREFQRVIGDELLKQLDGSAGRPEPDVIVACVGGGSNSMGIFYPYRDRGVDLVGVEAGGYGLGSGQHGASLGAGTPGVLHGAMTYLLQDDAGQVIEAHSVSAGLDYPGVGPEHAYFKESGVARYESVTDAEALEAFHLLGATEGIIPALESAHGLAWIMREAAALRGKTVVLNLSGRGDKDVQQVAALDE